MLFAAPMETLTLRKRHEEQLQKLEASWRKRSRELETQNRDLWKSTTTRLSADLTSIEQKYTHKRRYDAICPDIERKVEECYTTNIKAPLKCSKQVLEFVSCIDVAKRNALLQG